MDKIVSFVEQFNVKNPRYRSLGRFISIIGVVIFMTIASIFCFTALKKSSVKDFWTDETYGLNCAVRTNSLGHLIALGAEGQGSPAPLDYIFLKILDNIRKPLHLEWVPFNIYYRLNSLFWTLCAGTGTIFLFFGYFRSKMSNCFIFLMQIILLALALGYFYFRHDNLHFAMESRPYALWNALWFSFMALFLFYREFNWVLLLISTALALTSSGSFFQLLIFALCRFVFLFHKTRNFSLAFKKTFLEFSLPLFISIYYTLRGPNFGYSIGVEARQEYLKEFFVFWVHKFRVAIFSIFGIMMTLFYQKWREHSIVFFTILLLYLLGPLCNYAILSKGLFFSSRQYLYYDLTFCILALGASLMLPDYWEMLKSRYLPPSGNQ